MKCQWNANEMLMKFPWHFIGISLAFHWHFIGISLHFIGISLAFHWHFISWSHNEFEADPPGHPVLGPASASPVTGAKDQLCCAVAAVAHQGTNQGTIGPSGGIICHVLQTSAVVSLQQMQEQTSFFIAVHWHNCDINRYHFIGFSKGLQICPTPAEPCHLSSIEQ